MNNKKARVIALYLPQFHPIPENDNWWGKGFTEWTNVGKAKPLFKGHYQPRVPADLGYYDLRMPEAREAQAELAREAGIEGFCYYHYWFDTNKQLLERPFNEVLDSNKPDFPFMLCWANESWHAKFWNNEGESKKKLLIEQKYGKQEDHTAHFYHLLKAFKDKRYITIDGKPAFMIYRPLDFTDISNMIILWQKLAIENGLKGIYFIGQTTEADQYHDEILRSGFDAINSVRHYDLLKNRPTINKAVSRIKKFIKPIPFAFDYGTYYKTFVTNLEKGNNIYPTLIPNWDHTPRSGTGGYVLTDSTPSLFEMHLNDCIEIIKKKPQELKIIFLKSWNEWGEGNYIEPDLKYGKEYINVLKTNL